MRFISKNWNLGFIGYLLSKFRVFVQLVLLIGSISILFNSCEKWELEEQSFEEVSTGDFQIGTIPTEAILSASINGLVEGDFVSFHGHIWDLETNSDLTIENRLGQTQMGKRENGEYRSIINELIPGESYNYRAYIIYSNSEVRYGQIKTLITDEISPELQILNIERTESNNSVVNVETSFSNLPVNLFLNTYGVILGSSAEITLETAQVFPEPSIPVTETAFTFEQLVNIQAGENYLRPFILVNGKTYYGESQRVAIGDIWIQKADYGHSATAFSIAFSLGDKGYIQDGLSPGRDLWSYDPQLDSWSQQASFPGSNRGDVAFNIGNKGYILTVEATDFWEYDPQVNAWTEKAHFPGSVTFNGIGMSINGKGYVGLGSFDPELWEYDPVLDSWTPKEAYPGEGFFDAFSFSINSKGYVGTGSTSAEYSDFWEYDPAQDHWIKKADFGGGKRENAVSFSIGNKGYAGIGTSERLDKWIPDFWEYNPILDTWTQKADFEGGARTFSTGFSIGNKGYIGTGFGVNATEFQDWWEYTPD